MSTNEPRRRHVDLATGLRYHLLEWGSPKDADETVVLVHGFLDLSAGWCAMVRSGFADGRHIVAPDMRGHGDSDRVGAGGYYHFPDYLADFEALFEHLPPRPVSLVGHSMGGSICSYVAGTYPDRVSKLVLMEGLGPPERPATAPERVKQWIAAWRRIRETTPRHYASLEEAAARLRKHDALLSQPLSMELAERGTRAVDGGFEFKHDRLHATMGPIPFRVDVAAEFWSKITAPVLAIEGDQSNFRHMADEAAKRYAHIANLRREVLAGAGHMMQRHQPEALAALLGTFL